MLEAGADLLDLGGESTRPGATPVDPEAEIARVVPVIRELAPHATISIDTRRAATMRAAIAAGARVVNDVAALREAGALEAVADSDCSVVLMHMPGLDPATMQSRADYPDVALAVQRFLAERIAACEAAGIARARICVDPGIGFGKTLAHNLALIDRLPLLHGLGCRVLMAASRKGFIGRLGREPVAERRAPGSLAVALAAAERGADMLRVHDVGPCASAQPSWRRPGKVPEVGGGVSRRDHGGTLFPEGRGTRDMGAECLAQPGRIWESGGQTGRPVAVLRRR